MTPEDVWTNHVTARGRMMLSIFAACVENRSQNDQIKWCMLASKDADADLENVPAIWCRAVAVLRMTVALRRVADWN